VGRETLRRGPRQNNYRHDEADWKRRFGPLYWGQERLHDAMTIFEDSMDVGGGGCVFQRSLFLRFVFLFLFFSFAAAIQQRTRAARDLNIVVCRQPVELS
jgi:hypothetical protein